MKYLLKSTGTRALLKSAVVRNCTARKRGSLFDGEVYVYSSQLLDRNIAKKIRQARFAVCSAQAQHIHSGLMRQAPAVSGSSSHCGPAGFSIDALYHTDRKKSFLCLSIAFPESCQIHIRLAKFLLMKTALRSGDTTHVKATYNSVIRSPSS